MKLLNMKFNIAMYDDSSDDMHDIVNCLKRSIFGMVDICSHVNFVLRNLC